VQPLRRSAHGACASAPTEAPIGGRPDEGSSAVSGGLLLRSVSLWAMEPRGRMRPRACASSLDRVWVQRCQTPLRIRDLFSTPPPMPALPGGRPTRLPLIGRGRGRGLTLVTADWGG
jgi:hypothetical protein